MMQSSFPLPFSITKQRPTCTILSKPFLNTPSTKPFICYSFSSSSNSSNEKEEARWLREEQRWLREEQRWLREEQRWKAERDTLLHQIQTLQTKTQELQQHNSIQHASVSSSVLQVLKDGDLDININRIADSRSSAVPKVDTAVSENEVIVKEVISVSDTPVEESRRKIPRKESKSEESKRKTLRKGSEGDDVRELQEALQKLGFYSGEEDMEYSAFYSGTERAVKTWQATIGISEDGIMTSELLERLYIDEIDTSSLPGDENYGSDVASLYQTANGVPLSSITGIQQSTVKGDDVGVEVSQHGVFLLGENRWEDPSRLSGQKKEPLGMSGSKCLTCRGEGRLLCMECDGTGEPNIEEQFMEWVDEGTKCPYCEGQGYTVVAGKVECNENGKGNQAEPHCCYDMRKGM
ncbi:hypothetical protein LIER_26934 [Lithospermum erythrorhizon]|uniref:Peptidoglycan binding-like domain-containing protein n=1 Tax=Lithospermum erythrorhizon TaxID=34254 RepID=A0AAV3RE66_LITER